MPAPDDLTPRQWRAVCHRDGPLLILAGPGSGKTRVITRRIAQMTQQGVDPRSILAITFTNKGAGEMAERVAQLLPGTRVWVSTFHKFCARLLRQRAEAVGLNSNYTIYDTTDQRQVLKRVLKELDVDSAHFPVAKIAASISKAKNAVQSPEQFVRSFQDRVGDHLEAVVVRAYPLYQQRLLEANAVDFDDLLVHVVELLTEHAELRADLDARFRYVLVDEYQDTNLAQYRIVSALSQDHRNLCVTGDPDQSIYGWRGARIDNILRFESEFPDAAVVRLEESFRSTKQILRAADRLIAHNTQRKEKSLVTDNPEGKAVELLMVRDHRHEADAIAAEVKKAVEDEGRSWSDFAVFYRVNALSREIERPFTRNRVPYQVAAGVAFYERAEVKDMLAYLRLVQNPRDGAAFDRIVNTPRRGIGKQTRDRLSAWARTQELSELEAAAAAEECPTLSKRARKSLKVFAAMMDDLSRDAVGSVGDLMHKVIERTRITNAWIGSPSEQDQQRLANVQELLTAAHQYDVDADADPDARPSLEGFLETVSLAGEVDNLDASLGQVTLMTLHAAKGLEFPVVFVVGVEEHLIPHERALRSDDWRETEEERRLLFVGMTRAMQRLYLTLTRIREFRGRQLTTIPSRFLTETVFSTTDLTGENFYDHDVSDDAFFEETENQDVSATTDVSQAESTMSGPLDLQDGEQRPLLMTGADLLNGTGAAAPMPTGFAVGMTVRHPKYGQGTVTSISGFAKRRTVTVVFQNGDRSETFVAAKCPLQPVGIG